MTEQAILTALKSLAATLSNVMQQYAQGARRMEAMLFRVDGAVRRIAIEMGNPTREPAIIERLFREKLAALADPLDAGFGFNLIRLSATRTERDDYGVTGSGAPDQEKEIRLLVDRLAARFGSHRILSFQPNETHIPENAWTVKPAQYSRPSKFSWEKIRRPGDAPRRPLRLFARPEPVNFTVMPSPPHLSWRKAVHIVTQYEGPERIAMEWWRGEKTGPLRDYFRVEDNEGRRYWLYCNDLQEGNATARQWFVHGIFA
jgi:protein ImuB